MSEPSVQGSSRVRGDAGGDLRPGRMTTVMRALKASGAPRVLRIGVVQAGRVVEERVLADHGDVTVGGDESCTVVVAGLPGSVRVLHPTRAGYTFTVGPGMKGRVALDAGLADLAPGQSITLGETARGKLVMGTTTLLFQFVEPPPPRQKPQLPLSVRGGLEARIDWPLTVLVAMSFLLHFGFVGSMYSDWMDPPVTEGSVGSLVDMMKSLPAAPIEVADTEAQAPQTTPVPHTNEPKAPVNNRPDTTPSAPRSTRPGSVSDARAASMAAEADRMGMGILMAANGTTATDAALRRSEVPAVNLDDAARSTSTVGGPTDLRIGKSGGPLGRGPSTLESVVGDTHANGPVTAGTTRPTSGPKLDAQSGPVQPTVPVNGADAVIAGLRPRFRSCYQKGIDVDPNQEGKIVIAAKIGANGTVESASVSSNSGLSASVGACVANAVRNAQFEAPQGGSSTLMVPVTFRKQN